MDGEGLNIDPNAPEWGTEVSLSSTQPTRVEDSRPRLCSVLYGMALKKLIFGQIGAFTMPQNQASARVLKKCGFQFLRYEPTLDRDHYDLRREDWTAPN